MIFASLIDQVTIRIVTYSQKSRKVDIQITNKLVITMLTAMTGNVNNARTNDGKRRKAVETVSPKPLRPFCMIVFERHTAANIQQIKIFLTRRMRGSMKRSAYRS